VASRQIRLEFEQSSISSSRLPLGTAHGGLVRIKEQRSPAAVCDMGSGRTSNLYRRFAEYSAEGKWLRKSPLLFNWTRDTKNSGLKQGADFDRPGMAKPALVAGFTRVNERRANTSSGFTGPIFSPPKTRSQILPLSPSVGMFRLQDIREVLEEKGVQKESVDIIISRWAASTNRNYDGVWKRWRKFCDDENGDPFYPTESCVLAFLTREFSRYGTAAAVNSAISAIGSVTELLGRRALTSFPLVRSFRSSVNSLRPSKPALESTWDVNLIFKMMERMQQPELITSSYV
jgi:hypothetical protein